MQARILIALLVFWGPAYRAILDKLWMLQGGLSWVGQWAQLQTLIDLVSVPAFVGLGVGLTVLIAQHPAQHPEHAKPLLLAAWIMGLMAALPILLIAILMPDWVQTRLALTPAMRDWIPLAALWGWLSIGWGQISSALLGQRRHMRLLILTVCVGSAPIIALVASLINGSTEKALSHLLYSGTAAALLGNLWMIHHGWRWRHSTTNAKIALLDATRRLIKYLPAGLSIGLLTPLSGLLIRSTLAQEMDWNAAGTATALWHASDWILSGSVGVLYYHYLPILSQHARQGSLQPILHHIAVRVCLPATLALACLFLLQDLLLPALYDPRLHVAWSISAWFWAGDALRIAAALFLYGLFARQAGRTIAVGEWLSQPLLAIILMMGAAQSLLATGFAHWIVYAIYAGYNGIAVLWFDRYSPRIPALTAPTAPTAPNQAHITP